MTAELLTLRLGLSRGPSTRGLYAGRIPTPGIRLRLESQFGAGFDNTGARHRSIIAGKLDGGEFSLSSFIDARLSGVRLKALPVFPVQRWCHRFIRCAVDSPLRSPAEIAGRRATVHRYRSTTPVWVKGILQNDYGVKPQDVEWWVAEPDIGKAPLRPLPPDIRVKPIPPPHTREHAIELVEQGKIDAALEPYQALEHHRRLRRLVADFRRAEADYFRRTGAVHLNHVVVLREELVDANPWIAERLLEAFRQSLSMADAFADKEEEAEADWQRGILGALFTYSLKNERVRRSLEVLMEYQRQQGIIEQPIKLEELFFPQIWDN